MLRALAIAALASLTSCGPAPKGPAQLVVVIVLDQVGSWVLEEHLPVLREDGAIRSAIRKGAFHHRAAFPYAATHTGAGHAAIFTGAAPDVTGIVGNRDWDAARGKLVNILDDGRSTVIGRPDRFASPVALRTLGVADVLGRHGRGRVVSISMKDRGAVIPGGRRPHLALWFDTRLRGFTTSRHYRRAIPRWLARWQRKHPARKRLGVWRPLDRAILEGSDGAAGEGDWEGLGKVFPHDPRKATDVWAAFLGTPQSTELLADLARKAAEELALGEDEDPDLLAISVSGTDFVGHAYGPESWEVRDDLVRVDLALGRLIRDLEERGPVAVLVTADHGVTPMPESARSRGGRRILERELVTAVDRALDDRLGAGDWVRGFSPPYLYLSDPARSVPIAVEALRRLPGIHDAIDVRALLDADDEDDGDPVRRSVRRSLYPGRGGDVFVVPARFAIHDEGTPEGTGTGHGSPWPYDTEIPVIVAGPSVRHLETREPVDALRIAATIAALLRIEPPEAAAGPPLPGVRP